MIKDSIGPSVAPHSTFRRGEKEHKITITLPDDAQYNTSGESKSYKYTIPAERESNTFVFAEQLQDDGPPAAKKPRAHILKRWSLRADPLTQSHDL